MPGGARHHQGRRPWAGSEPDRGGQARTRRGRAAKPAVHVVGPDDDDVGGVEDGSQHHRGADDRHTPLSTRQVVHEGGADEHEREPQPVRGQQVAGVVDALAKVMASRVLGEHAVVGTVEA